MKQHISHDTTANIHNISPQSTYQFDNEVNSRYTSCSPFVGCGNQTTCSIDIVVIVIVTYYAAYPKVIWFYRV